MDKKMESIKKEIRSVLISYPKGVSLDDFRRTYKDLLGVRLPTREFGFTLDIDFLHSIPDVVHIEVDKNGMHQLFALADESTEHIKKLVGKQRVPKEKPKKKSYGFSFSYKPSEATRLRVSTTRCRPFVPAVLRAEIIQIVKLYPDGIGYAAFILAYQSMFQRSPNLSFLSSSPVEILQKLQNAIPELEVKVSGGQQKLFFVDQNNEMFSDRFASEVKSSFQHFKAINKTTSSALTMKSNEPNGFSDVSAVSDFVKYNTKKVLKGYPDGILAVHFPILYESFTQKAFDLHELGYNCLLDFVDALPDIIIRVQSPESANDWILYHIDYAANINDASRSSTPTSICVQTPNNSRVSNLKEKSMVKTAPPALQFIQQELSANETDQYFPVFISAFVNPSLFWFQLQTDDAINNLNKLEKEMEYFYNSQLRIDYRLKDSDVLIGSSCVAQFPTDHHWYRCVISSLLNAENVKVFLVDYGSWETIPRSHLFYLKYRFICLPAQAFQAQLALVQPLTKVGSWEINAQKRFLELCNKAFIMAKVNSMQYQVASVFLCDTSGEEEIHINQTLVNENLAEYSIQNEYLQDFKLAASKVPSAMNGSTSSNPLTSSEKISNVNISLKSPHTLHSHSINGHQTLNHTPENQLISKIKALQFSNVRKSVRRILLGDGYHIHIIIVDKDAYVSGEDLYNLLWKGKGADVLACRLEFKGITIPTMSISKEKFADLFSECERYDVGGFDKTESSYSVILYPLKYSLKVLNVFGHPSSKVRETLCQEIKEFNPLASVWSKSEENGEHYDVLSDEEDKHLDRLCSFDLKTMREGLVCKRLKLEAIHKGEPNASFLIQMKQIETTQSYISRRIEEIEALCLKYSEEIS